MRLPTSLIGASCGAVLATWYSISPETAPAVSKPALCDAAATPGSQSHTTAAPRVVPANPPQAAAVSLAELRRWLERRGASVPSIQFCQASETDAGRFGIFANQQACRCTTCSIFGKFKAAIGFGRGDVTLASFPVETTLTAATLCMLPNQGQIFKELLEEGLVDERAAVMLHLVVEKLRGKESPLRPWIGLLPGSFHTPLFWDDADVEWLKGTTLYKATQMKKKMLAETWRRVEPVAQQLALAEGVEKKPSYQDFLWAYSIFWSRAISMPIPTSSGPIVYEGIVPGLDFANHDANSRCRWTMGPARKPTSPPPPPPRDGTTPTDPSSSSSIAISGSPPSEVRLVCPQGCRLKPGTEITINYGDKSNEELLYLYGFALENNPDDVLMIACPLPPHEEWDETLWARVELLRSRGLAPQVFLPAKHLAEASKTRRSRSRFRGRRAGDALFNDADEAVAELDLPENVMETLEVFVMEKKDVAAELEAQGGTGSAAGRAPSAPGAHSMTEMESSGLRLALLTTLVRLLELKVRELESPESGTGPVEHDERLLESVPQMNHHQRSALIYRLGQKKLARQYLLYTNALLQQEMRHLRALAN